MFLYFKSFTDAEKRLSQTHNREGGAIKVSEASQIQTEQSSSLERKKKLAAAALLSSSSL